jgi:hypothetical protein
MNDDCVPEQSQKDEKIEDAQGQEEVTALPASAERK